MWKLRVVYEPHTKVVEVINLQLHGYIFRGSAIYWEGVWGGVFLKGREEKGRGG